MPKFRTQEAGLDGIQATVISFDCMVVLPGLAVVAEHPNGCRQLIIVGRDRARFPTGSKVFTGIKAECCRMPHGSCSPPAALASRKVLGAMSLARIFDHLQPE